MPTVKGRPFNRFLKSRRERLDEEERFHGREGVKQADIALAIEESQSQVSKIERELVDLKEWKPSRLYDLLMAYRIAPGEMLRLADEYGLPTLREYVSERSAMYGVREGQRVRYLGVAASGELREDSEPEYVNVPDPIAQRYRLEDVFAVTINEQTMLEESVKTEMRVPCIAYFHRKLQPESGEVICAYLPNHDLVILKRWAADQYAVLKNCKGDREPIVISQAEKLVTEGVYLTYVPITNRLK